MQECKLTDEINNIESKMTPKELTVEDIAKVIENWTKIPVQKSLKKKLVPYYLLKIIFIKSNWSK